jgi:hypothetical protein
MIDPLTALAAIKTGISAGKQLHDMTKELGSFFEGVEGAKRKHSKKKGSIFASADEQAMATWAAAENARTAEAELREWIIAVKGYSSYQELLRLRREIAQERKEAERQARIEADERKEVIMTVVIVIMGILVAGIGVALWGASNGWF